MRQSRKCRFVASHVNHWMISVCLCGCSNKMYPGLVPASWPPDIPSIQISRYPVFPGTSPGYILFEHEVDYPREVPGFVRGKFHVQLKARFDPTRPTPFIKADLTVKNLNPRLRS